MNETSRPASSLAWPSLIRSWSRLGAHLSQFSRTVPELFQSPAPDRSFFGEPLPALG